MIAVVVEAAVTAAESIPSIFEFVVDAEAAVEELLRSEFSLFLMDFSFGNVFPRDVESTC